MISASDYASKHNLSAERVRQLCKAGRIPGARKIGSQWVIPSDAPIPERKPGRPTALAKAMERVARSKSKMLGLSFPYDWSNPDIPDAALILNVLERGIYEDICIIAAHYGLARLRAAIPDLPDAVANSRWLARMLNNIEIGFSNAENGISA